jgi:hypothetical protein
MSVVIEYPAVGLTYSTDAYGVYRYSVYPRGSVLEGQERRSALGQFPTLEAARAAFPEADYYGDDHTGYAEISIPHTAPAWFDPIDAGEAWDEY